MPWYSIKSSSSASAKLKQTCFLFHITNKNSNSDSDYVNPFTSCQAEEGRLIERFFQSSDGIKIEIPEFLSRLQPGEFLDWLSVIEKIFD